MYFNWIHSLKVRCIVFIFNFFVGVCVMHFNWIHFFEGIISSFYIIFFR